MEGKDPHSTAPTFRQEEDSHFIWNEFPEGPSMVSAVPPSFDQIGILPRIFQDADDSLESEQDQPETYQRGTYENYDMDNDDFLVEYEDAEDDSPPEVLKISRPQPENTTQHSSSSTKRKHGTIPPPPTTYYSEITNLEAGSDSGRRSYLSIIPSTIQRITKSTTLFIWHANFHPAIRRRFSSVIVSCKFTKPQTPPASKAVQIQEYAPHKAYGSCSREQRSISWGLEFPVSIPAGPISVGVTPSTQQSTCKEVEHAFTITGSARGSPYRNTCVWTVEENASTQRGIPSELQLAALVGHDGDVVVEIEIEGWTVGGYLPTHHLRPKTSARGRRKVIDPKRYESVLKEFRFGEDEMGGCLDLLGKWTGRVDGAVLEFDQVVILP